MSKLKLLQEEMEKHVTRQNELILIESGSADVKARELTEDEQAEFDLLESEIEKLKPELERFKKMDEIRKRNAAMRFSDPGTPTSENQEKANITKNYSLFRAIRSEVEKKPLDGIELEVHQEAIKEAREKGQSVSGIGLPSFMMDLQSRDLVVGTPATAGNLVATDLGAVVPALRPRPQVIALGARVLSGLSGNLDLPIGNALASATWEGEIDAAAETTPTTSKLSLTPNRLAAFTNVSKQLMYQSDTSVESWVRGELSNAVARAVDIAAINGSGSSNQPLGILNKSGIGDVAGGTNGGVPTYTNVVALETAIAEDNADVLNMNYLTTPGIRGVLKSNAQTANNAGYIWTNDNMLNGYNAAVSTHVPSDLDKGTSTGVCHAIIFGDFTGLIVANWGLVDITVDPYTLAKNGEIQLVINSYWDIGIPHAQKFAAMKDALLS